MQGFGFKAEVLPKEGHFMIGIEERAFSEGSGGMQSAWS
jgi:hypothetical protein